MQKLPNPVQTDHRKALGEGYRGRERTTAGAIVNRHARAANPGCPGDVFYYGRGILGLLGGNIVSGALEETLGRVKDLSEKIVALWGSGGRQPGRIGR